MTRSDITWIFIYFEVASSVCWFHPNFGLFLTDHYIKNIFSRPCCQSNNGYLIWPLDPEHTMSSDPPFSLSFIHHKNMAVLTNICLWLADWLGVNLYQFFQILFYKDAFGDSCKYISENSLSIPAGGPKEPQEIPWHQMMGMYGHYFTESRCILVWTHGCRVRNLNFCQS